MNWDRIESGWKQGKGDVSDQWGDINEDQLTSSIQVTYGYAYAEAESELTEWQQHLRDIKRDQSSARKAAMREADDSPLQASSQSR